MIFHPGILAILGGSIISSLMLVYAVFLGFRIALQWDMTSSSAEQLTLERKTYLVSTVMKYLLGFGVLSVFLFVHTAENIHPFFIGAMCATGSLNANPVGWYALGMKGLLFFLSGIWIGVNSLDQRGEDYPLVRTKYLMLLVLSPVTIADLALTYRYFSGLDPVVITSCCGTLFGSSSDRVSSVVSILPTRHGLGTVYLVGLTLIAIQFYDLLRGSAWTRYASLALAPVFLVTGIFGILAVVAPHVYELPDHHCPFDMFQGEYRYLGYPLFGSLLAGTLLATLPGITQGFSRIPSLRAIIPAVRRRWTWWALAAEVLFLCCTGWPVVFSALRTV